MRPPDSDDTSPRENSYSRSACTECQRRKQKCNREWPCNNCQKRKVADKCRFNHPSVGSERSPPDSTLNRKRPLNDPSASGDVDSDEEDDSDSDDEDDADGFEALGYGSTHFLNINSDSERKAKPAAKQYLRTAPSCPQLARALQVLPPRPITDLIMTNFINSVNLHYYLIYPSTFLEEYQSWWDDRARNRPLSVHWTCLFLTICACSVQYTSVELQQKLEYEIGDSVGKLSEKYHNTARELHSIIPVGSHHLLSVQQLMYSCYWLKTEARFVECWHVLSAAIREAQELGIHQEAVTGPIPEFDREMRRRVWCVIDTWDWQISALLSRPKIVDRSDCDVGLPSLKLEDYSPSPLLHMRLQSELIGRLSDRFGGPKNVTQPKAIREYQLMIEQWMRMFPPPYRLDNPDRAQDDSKPWIKLHRYQLHTMSFSMVLDPMRAYLARPVSRESSDAELRIRAEGIDYALKLMTSLRGLFECVWPRDTKFHAVVFSVFDTAAVLCSAVMHDADQSIPRKAEIFTAIDKALGMLNRLKNVAKMGKTSHKILLRLSQKLTRPQPEDAARKKPKPVQVSPTPPFDGHMKNSFGGSDRAFSDGGVGSSVSPGSILGGDAAVFYQTPPDQIVGSDPSAMFPTSRAPLPGHISANMGMLNFTSAPDGTMIPPISSQGFHNDTFFPTTYMDMTSQDQNPYAYLWAGIPDQQLEELAAFWRWQDLHLPYPQPLMQDNPNQGYH